MYVLKPEFLSKSVFSAGCRGHGPSCIDGPGSEWSPSLSASDVLVIHASQIFSTGARIWIKVSGWFSDKTAAPPPPSQCENPLAGSSHRASPALVPLLHPSTASLGGRGSETWHLGVSCLCLFFRDTQTRHWRSERETETITRELQELYSWLLLSR